MRCEVDCVISYPAIKTSRGKPVFALGLSRAVPFCQGYTWRWRPQARTQCLFDRCQHGWPSLAANSMTIKVGIELDVFRSALAAAEPSVRLPPVGRPAVAAEDIERLPNRDRAIVPAAAALDEQIGTLTAEILEPSDDACYARGLTRRGHGNKNMQ